MMATFQCRNVGAKCRWVWKSAIFDKYLGL